MAVPSSRLGPLDIVVANHARSSAQSLEELTVEELDRSWAVNARASVLLAKAFAAQARRRPTRGRVVLFTSGQHLGPDGRRSCPTPSARAPSTR